MQPCTTACAGVLATIQREGFNTRLAKDTGHLGSGAYFARNISHALMYAKQVKL